MRRLILTAALPAALLILIASAPFAAISPPQGGPGGPPSQLGTYMEEMQGTLKAIQAVVDAKGPLAGALPDVTKLQKLIIDAKAELPETVGALTDPKALTKATLAYKTQMQNVVRGTLELETALLNEDPKKAAKALRELDNLKSAGHGEFRPQGGR